MPSPKSLATLIIPLMLLCRAGGCGEKPTGFAETQHLWDKRTLLVCFASTLDHLTGAAIELDRSESLEQLKIEPIHLADRILIKSAVARSFSLETTGIEFIGWQDCPSNEPEMRKIDVVLFSAPFPQHSITAAAGCIGDPQKSVDKERSSIRIEASAFRDYPDRKEFLRFADFLGIGLSRAEISHLDVVYPSLQIVHEFGHVSGLRHEHCRLDGHKILKRTALGDRNIFWWAGYEQGESQDFAPAQAIGDFDFLSAMSYGHEQLLKFGEKAKLFCNHLNEMSDAELTGSQFYFDTYLALTNKAPTTEKPNPTIEKNVLQSKLCISTFYMQLVPQGENDSFLSPGDQETLSHLYNGLPISSRWKRHQDRIESYLSKITKNHRLVKLWGLTSQ